MNGIRVILTGTSTEVLWPRLPVPGELTIVATGTDGTDGSIIHATFRILQDDWRLSAPVEVDNPVFTYTGGAPAVTAAAHYHTAEHHLECARQARVELVRGARVVDGGMPMSDGLLRERAMTHMELAGIQGTLAVARTLGALLAVTPTRQHHAAEAEAAAWSTELDATTPVRPRAGADT